MIKWLKRLFGIKPKNKCKHINTTNIYMCWQDRISKDQCNDCGEIVYSEL